MIDYEYIARYIHNELSDSERAFFEQRLKSDSEFAEAYQLYSSIEDTMQTDSVGDEEAFREKLVPYQEKYFSGNTIRKKGNIRSVLYIAASIAAIAILIILLIPFNNSSSKSNDTLYAQFANYEKVDETIRGDNDSIFIKAANYFNAKKYELAAPLFDQIKTQNIQALFWLAVCNVETKNYAKAHELYDSLINGTSTLKDKALWYKALCYLKQNDKPSCKATLQRINNTSDYFDKATAILKEL